MHLQADNMQERTRSYMSFMAVMVHCTAVLVSAEERGVKTETFLACYHLYQQRDFRPVSLFALLRKPRG